MLTAPSPSPGWLGLVPTCSENFPCKPGLDTRHFLVKQGVTAKALKIGPQVESKGSRTHDSLMVSYWAVIKHNPQSWASITSAIRKETTKKQEKPKTNLKYSHTHTQKTTAKLQDKAPAEAWESTHQAFAMPAQRQNPIV